MKKRKKKMINEKKYQKILKSYTKVDEKVIRCDSTETEEYKTHQRKSFTPTNNTDINKITVFN